MGLKNRTDRQAEFKMSYDNFIGSDNEVRVIDAYVDSLALGELGFVLPGQKKEGSPAFGADCLLKLHLYGYMNRVRSSRQLAKECVRNVELWWLLEGLRPKYHIVSDFRRDNSEALREVFKNFTALLKEAQLIGGQTIAIDSTKIRAQNSKKTNFSQQKLKRQESYIKKRVSTYMNELEASDELDEQETSKKKELEEKIAFYKTQLAAYEQIEETLKSSGQTQVSLIDADARNLTDSQQVARVCYNIQVATDEKNCLIVHYETTNTTDRKALSEMAIETKELVGKETMDVLADKGYHNGEQIAKCNEEDITTYVAPPTSTSGAKEGFKKSDFKYDPEQDIYECPQGAQLQTNGQWYKKQGILVKAYKTQACSSCPLKNQCTKSKKGRKIERSQYQDRVDENDKRVASQKDYYRTRQAIVEHPFGTIKVPWGYHYTLLRGMKKVDGEMALIFTCYNMKRAIKILGVQGLIRQIKAFFWLIFESLLPRTSSGRKNEVALNFLIR